MKKRNLLIAIFGLIGLSLVTSCSMGQASLDGSPIHATSTVTPSVEETLSTGLLISTLAASDEGAVLIYQPVYRIEPSEEPAWNRLTNLRHGFELLVPDNVAVGTSLTAIWIQWEEQQLLIAFQGTDEETNIQRTGIPEGRPVRRGSVRGFGQEIPRYVLVSEGLDMAVLYQGGATFEVAGGMVFAISLDTTFEYYRPGAEYAGIPMEIQDLADQIVTSLALLDQ